MAQTKAFILYLLTLVLCVICGALIDKDIYFGLKAIPIILLMIAGYGFDKLLYRWIKEEAEVYTRQLHEDKVLLKENRNWKN